MDLAPSDSDEWLVRTSKNELLGPFTKQTVIERIQSGQLGPEDEVCQANHYWIYLDERDEVVRQLGIQPPGGAGLSEEDEVTDTQTDARTEEIVYRSEAAPDGSGETLDVPELGGEVGENTAVLSNRALREFQGRAGSRVTHQRSILTPSPKPFVLGAVERPSVLRWIMSILVAIIIALIALVAYVLHQGR